MGRVTYLHHYLPTLWFSVLMSGVLLDHFIFRSHRLTPRTKKVVFGLVAGAVVGTWWFFRACAWGIEGPAKDMVGRKWRKVRFPLSLSLSLSVPHAQHASSFSTSTDALPFSAHRQQSWNLYD